MTCGSRRTEMCFPVYLPVQTKISSYSADLFVDHSGAIPICLGSQDAAAAESSVEHRARPPPVFRSSFTIGRCARDCRRSSTENPRRRRREGREGKDDSADEERGTDLRNTKLKLKSILRNIRKLLLVAIRIREFSKPPADRRSHSHPFPSVLLAAAGAPSARKSARAQGWRRRGLHPQALFRPPAQFLPPKNSKACSAGVASVPAAGASGRWGLDSPCPRPDLAPPLRARPHRQPWRAPAGSRVSVS
jgi:hypothetical protein